jgi:thiol-disulfide isomerase/thioredoxin
MRVFILATVLLLIPVSVGAQSSQQTTLSLKDIRGRQLRLADYKGKVVLINFWATWCLPCRAEIPDLIKMQRQYRAQGLRIIGITYPPENISEVRRFTQKLKVNYRVAMGTKATKSLFTSSETLPMTVVIDRDGVVRNMVEGIMYGEEFEQMVKPLLFSPSGYIDKAAIMPAATYKAKRFPEHCLLVRMKPSGSLTDCSFRYIFLICS